MNSILISILQFLPCYTYRCSWKTMGFFFLHGRLLRGEITIRRWGRSSWTLWSQQKWSGGMTLVVHWLRLRLPMQGVWIRSLIKGLRSHTPRGQKNQTLKRRKSKAMELKSINICPKGILIFKWKVSDPRTHLASSNTHYLWLLEARRSSWRPSSARSYKLLPFLSIFPI